MFKLLWSIRTTLCVIIVYSCVEKCKSYRCYDCEGCQGNMHRSVRECLELKHFCWKVDLKAKVEKYSSTLKFCGPPHNDCRYVWNNRTRFSKNAQLAMLSSAIKCNYCDGDLCNSSGLFSLPFKLMLFLTTLPYISS